MPIFRNFGVWMWKEGDKWKFAKFPQNIDITIQGKFNIKCDKIL